MRCVSSLLHGTASRETTSLIRVLAAAAIGPNGTSSEEYSLLSGLKISKNFDASFSAALLEKINKSRARNSPGSNLSPTPARTHIRKNWATLGECFCKGKGCFYFVMTHWTSNSPLSPARCIAHRKADSDSTLVSSSQSS